MVSPDIFDTPLVRRRLARAAAGRPADFLLARVAADMADRLETVKRGFEVAADIGTPGSALATTLATLLPEALVLRVTPNAEANPAFRAVRGDAEALPLAGRLDLAVSALALQTANDLPGALVQIRRALKPDGLFLGALVGGRTLHELRSVLTQADVETSGGASPRVAPFADVRDMGGLLQRAGFALPVADSEIVTVRYDHLFALMADLRAMGATNALVARGRRFARRAFFARAAALYAERHADPDGRIRATFEIVSLSGWAPHESQQKPARRGSGTVSLTRVLGDRSGTLE
jgi:SAM-dependent methyltransferase